MMTTRQDYENQIAYLKAVCRIAADRLRDGGTFPIKGETWGLLDYAAGQETQRATLNPSAMCEGLARLIERGEVQIKTSSQSAASHADNLKSNQGEAK